MKSLKLTAAALCAATILAAGCTPEQAGSAAATPAEPTPTPCGDKITAVGTMASSETAYVAANVIDGLTRTRWRPTDNDVEWVAVDLAESCHITRVVIHWDSGLNVEGPAGEDYHATDYEVQISDDAENWTTVRSMVGGDGGIDDFTGLDAAGRYVRVYCTKPSTLSGGPDTYNVWEIEVYGETTAE